MEILKTKKTKPKTIMLLFFLFLNTVWSVLPVFSQEFEEEGPLTAWKWYYRQRNYPRDSIPWGAYEDAAIDRDALRQSSGYQFSALQWELIGPMPLETYSGRTNFVKYDPRIPTGNTIYITGPGCGIWKTTNGGQNWVNKSGDLPTLSAGAFAIDAERNILYFGSGSGALYFGDGLGMRIFKSTNDGTNWTSISNGLVPGTPIFKIAINPNNNDNLFAATFHGLYRTTNGGGNWSKVIPITGADSVCIDVCFSRDGDRVYVTGPSYNTWPGTQFNGIGFWRSTNGGVNFESVPPESGFPRQANVPYGKLLCAVSQASNDYLYMVNFENDGSVYVYKSTDGGSSFTNFYRGNTPIKYHLLVRCSDDNPEICFVGYEQLYRTTNGGQNWVEKTSPHVDHLSLDFNPADENAVIVGCDGGVFGSTNLGDSWSSFNQNLCLTLFWRMASSHYDEDFLVGGMHDYGYGYKYPEGGPKYWKNTSYGGDGGNMTASPFKSKYFVASKIMGLSTTQGQPIDYSFDGINFSRTYDYLLTTWTVELSPFVWHPTQPGVIYTARYTQWTDMDVLFYKSTNYGVNWGGSTPLRRFSQPVDYIAPATIAISPSNPETIIMILGNGNEWWHFTYDLRSRLYKSTNGGLNWIGVDNEPPTPLVIGGSGGTPDRYFTNVEFDPKDENLVYLTVSGYYYPGQNEGHVFKSTDGGYNWSSISGSLPDIPVNDLFIHYPDCDTKQLVIATDAGIYVTDAASISWKEVADGFPNTVAYNLDYNRLSGKLRASTWGYGAWEFQLANTVYVQDNLFITDDVSLDAQIVVCNGGKLTLGHANLSDPFTINFNNGAKITVQDGGQIDAPSGNAVTITSQSGQWGGIEFQSDGYGTLNNVTFNNTNTPIVVNGYGSASANEIVINNCHFNEGQVLIDSRNNVSILSSDFTFTNFGADNSAIYVNGSEDVDVQHNTITFNNNLSGATGVAANYSTVYITDNTIHKSYTGISVSNSNTGIGDNTIDNPSGNPDYAYIGIELLNCYSSGLKYNTVTGYQRGIYMYYSSPEMLENEFTNVNTAGSYIDALDAEYDSWPRLQPSYQGEEMILDGGNNTLVSSAEGNGIEMNQSWPLTDYGYNTIYGLDNYITGDVGQPPWEYYYSRCNDWTEEPVPGKFTIEPDVEVVYDPYIPNCDGQGGGKAGGAELVEYSPDDPEVQPATAVADPPSYIIVDRGYGHYDTLLVRNSSIHLPADQMLYQQANKQELLGNFAFAINKYKQVVTNYQDSLSALKSLKRIITCFDRLDADTNQYSVLREYYLNLAQANHTDTTFYQVAKELAVKTLVRKAEYVRAIGEYENIIETSRDSAEILCAELNIVQTYMLIKQHGDAPSFTGKLSYLKPDNILDGYRKIQMLLHGKTKEKEFKPIPNEFTLSQNYPNPFNPYTYINYSLPNPTKVTIKVYDILGKLVKELVNEYKEAGYFTVKFDGTNIASGVYFYRIEAGSFVDTKKMVLVK